MKMKIVLDGERLEEFHGGLGTHFGDAIKEENVFLRVLRVIVVIGVQLKENCGKICHFNGKILVTCIGYCSLSSFTPFHLLA